MLGFQYPRRTWRLAAPWHLPLTQRSSAKPQRHCRLDGHYLSNHGRQNVTEHKHVMRGYAPRTKVGFATMLMRTGKWPKPLVPFSSPSVRTLSSLSASFSQSAARSPLCKRVGASLHVSKGMHPAVMTVLPDLYRNNDAFSAGLTTQGRSPDEGPTQTTRLAAGYCRCGIALCSICRGQPQSSATPSSKLCWP